MRLAMVTAALVLSSCARQPATTVEVANGWAQPVTAAGNSAAVYLTITAKCTTPDTLIAVSAQAPQTASLHASSTVDDRLRMTPVASLPIPCDRPTMLKPMGTHVMVTGITRPLGIGAQIPLTLRFKDAGEVAVTAEVTSMAVLEDVDPMHMHMGHGGMAGMNMH